MTAKQVPVFVMNAKDETAREALANIFLCHTFLLTAFVLLFPLSNEEPRNSAAIFSPITRLILLLLVRVFFLASPNSLCRVARAFFCYVATGRQISHEFAACSLGESSD